MTAYTSLQKKVEFPAHTGEENIPDICNCTLPALDFTFPVEEIPHDTGHSLLHRGGGLSC